MLALIKREIRDHVLYFLAAIIFSAILVGLQTVGAYNFDWQQTGPYFGLMTIPTVMIFVFGLAGMGVSQMYIDKNRKISAFLTSLPVTRGRIFTAKVISGLLVILIVLTPVAIAAATLNSLLGSPIPAYGKLITDIFTTAFLMALACYSLGLLTGWTTSKLAPSFGGLGMAIFLVTMISIKGFGLQIQLLLVLIIAASLTRTWRKYMSTPL
ncbi:MAG: hypothetical protein ABIF19_02810 [Planctomycetota bacterium]